MGAMQLFSRSAETSQTIVSVVCLSVQDSSKVSKSRARAGQGAVFLSKTASKRGFFTLTDSTGVLRLAGQTKTAPVGDRGLERNLGSSVLDSDHPTEGVRTLGRVNQLGRELTGDITFFGYYQDRARAPGDMDWVSALTIDLSPHAGLTENWAKSPPGR